MASQKKTLKLSFPHELLDRQGEKAWKVIQVTNSISYHPGQYLFKAEVQDLIDLGAYDITFVPKPEK